MKKIFLATLAGIGFASVLVSQPSWAQTINPYDPQGVDAQNNTDPFAQQVEQNPFGMFQLLHRANLGGLNPGETYQQQRQQLDDAAAAFRKRQQQMLQGQQQQVTTPNQAIAPLPVITLPPSNQQ